MLIQHIKVMNELMNGMKDEEELLISVFMYTQRKCKKKKLIEFVILIISNSI